MAIASFFVFTFLWTWGLWGISTTINPSAPGLSGALFLASAYGPGLAAFVVVFAFGGAMGLRRWLATCLCVRVGWRWYSLAALVPPLIMVMGLAIHAALGGAILPSAYDGRILIAVAQFPIIAIFGGPLGEEFGWRGFALPALSARMGWRRASLIIGALWGLWHVPLFLIAGTAQADLPIALFLASTVGLSVVMARLSVIARYSVLPAILLHSVINWCSMVVPVMPQGGDTRAYSLIAGIAILVALVALLKPGPK